MLKVVTGRYHPDLESALVEEIRSLKTSDPLAPLAVVVPSDPLKRRLKQFLCLEKGLSLLDVYFFTFHQLATRLQEERNSSPSEPCTAPLKQFDHMFFEQLIRHIFSRKHAALAAFQQLGDFRGNWGALWSTLRDLRDATVDPATALRAVAEGLFESHEAPALQSLFTLHAMAQEAGRTLRAGTADDLAAAAIPWAASSPLLGRFRRLCYYGFYDVTQVQLSLFEAVVKRCPVTLYFPLCDDPAFAFARRFFERHIEPLRGAEPDTSAPPGKSVEPPQIRVMDAVGPDDELTAACKEILTLVETHGYRFDDIGLVARTLEPYRASLRRILDQHRIPFVTREGVPVVQDPSAKVLAQLAALPLTEFYRAPVLDVLTSPFYRRDRQEPDGLEPRPDLWRLAVRELGITRGEDEWRRLSSTGALEARASEDDEEPVEWNGTVRIEAAQIRLLGEMVARLIRDCRALPEQGSAAELTDAFMALAGKHLAIPGVTEDLNGEGEASGRVAARGEAIRGVFTRLRQLDPLEETLRWEDWTALFMDALERTSTPIEPEDHAGVMVLDAMDARGVSVRALIVLGLNEKIFPRYIREDAFLRDRNRRVLDEALGYKIDEKLAGYDEERLLFALLQQAASQRLYFLWQRADANGRPLAPSTYLDLFLKPEGRDRGPEISVPRRLADRLGLPLYVPALLTREELSVGLVLQGRDPVALLDSVDRGGALFEHGLGALHVLDSEARGLGDHDGMTGPLERQWAALTSRGLAPTSLEQYAQCPFRYFSAKVLGLEPIWRETGGDVPPPVLGELCHDTLKRCYQRLVEAGWPKTELPRETRQAAVASAADAVFASYATVHGTGYALTWQLARDTVVALAGAMVEADEEDFRESGFEPVRFEVEAEGSLEGVDPASFKGVRIAGRLDRLDRRAQPPALRVVDYKYRHGSGRGIDRNLVAAAVRGFRLQPPLYALMVPAGQATQVRTESVDLAFLIRKPSPQIERARFDADAWDGPAAGLMKKTLEAVVDGIREGRHLILPDGYCDHCEFSACCRRFHGPTWWRAHSSPPAKLLRQLRKQRVKSEE